ncbi:unnamed protein product, partial [Laminaria digitata]
VKALVEAGVDIDAVDEEGCSALHLAVFRGFDKVVEELVSAGAKIYTSDSEGETPLHTACGHGSLEMVRALLRDSRGKQALSAKGSRGVHLEMSPLHRAALGGHCEVVRELLGHGSSLDSLTGNARTPLHAAAMSGSADAVHFLLDLNPSSLEATDQEGRTALHLASGHRLGSDGTLTALLAAGADMESKTALGETSLLKACKALRVSAVRILLRWGADEAAIDADGRTPVAMVSQMLRSQHPGVFRDMLKTILRVLDGAPADRVWRRRGWLLMVRSYSRREGFHVAEGGGGGGGGDCGRSRPGRKADYRENIAVLLRPRSNCANPRVICAAQDSKKDDDDDDDDWCHARTRRIVVEPERLLERSCGRIGFGGGEGGGDRALRSVVERAVGVEEEGIFRSIVAFL